MSFHLPSLSSDLTPWMDPLLSPQRCAIVFSMFSEKYQRMKSFGFQDCLSGSKGCWSSRTVSAGVSRYCLLLCSGNLMYEGMHIYVKFNVVKNIDRLGSGQAWSSRRIGWSSYKDRPRRATAHSPKVSICISQSLSKYVFSFDIDVLDPSEAPATGTRVRGGLTLR